MRLKDCEAFRKFYCDPKNYDKIKNSKNKLNDDWNTPIVKKKFITNFEKKIKDNDRFKNINIVF